VRETHETSIGNAGTSNDNPIKTYHGDQGKVREVWSMSDHCNAARPCSELSRPVSHAVLKKLRQIPTAPIKKLSEYGVARPALLIPYPGTYHVGSRTRQYCEKSRKGIEGKKENLSQRFFGRSQAIQLLNLNSRSTPEGICISI
jgi:hypothetical protein